MRTPFLLCPAFSTKSCTCCCCFASPFGNHLHLEKSSASLLLPQKFAVLLPCVAAADAYGCYTDTLALTCFPFKLSMPAVLLDCNPFRHDMVRITLAEYRSAEQTALMTQVTEQAAAAWKLPGHPGFHAAHVDSQPLLNWLQDLLRQQVGLPFCLLNAN